MTSPVRRLPIGAEPQPDGRTHFRVWAPRCTRVHVVFESAAPVELSATPDGYFEGMAEASAGDQYRYRLDDGSDLCADPASRFQPDGPFGPSAIVDPSRFQWTDASWSGVTEGPIVYEMHVGTFTREGTWRAAVDHLASLVELGITVIEVMPVADFPGQFGWGYDGVNLFAPTRLYGEPDDFRAFVDRAHALGLSVILDVVYNHFGPAGFFLDRFSNHYLSTGTTEWGRAINFDDPHAGPVREFYLANAAYWIDEFHLDGLRLDATQSINDRTPSHILSEISVHARRAAPGRTIWIVAENEPQNPRLVRPHDKNGYGLDALWNDDFHHTAIVALTGRREAYYTDYRGTPQELLSAMKHGFLYQGQWYSWQKQPRGRAGLELSPAAFVTFLENHDQVANSAHGWHLQMYVSRSKYRALAALMLLAPPTPMLFQGQEFASSSPFLYFADHQGDLGNAVRAGRVEFLRQFPSYARPEVVAQLPDPGARDTFDRCKMNHAERRTHAHVWQFHADLLHRRKNDATLASQGRHGVDGAVIAPEALLLRIFGETPPDDRLIVVNLGPDLLLAHQPEPLMAPPDGTQWSVEWCSEDPRYGGSGAAIEVLDDWRMPAESTLLLAPRMRHDSDGEAPHA